MTSRVSLLLFVCVLQCAGNARVTTAQTLWSEDAESGTTYVLDNTGGSYSLIQSDVAGQGDYAFHLANPGFQDNWFGLDTTVAVQSDTKLFFLSRLGWATPTQVAKVQISTNGGASWPTTIYDQAGTGDSGEGSFGLKQVDLSAYTSQNVRFRFMYDHVSGSNGTVGM